MKNINGEPGVEGRGNIGNTTMNLPRLGLLAHKDIHKFFILLDDLIEKAKDSLIYRKNILTNLKISDLPFVAGQNLIRGSEGLSLNDSILPILDQGTYGIGYIGVAETLVALTGKHHGESEESRELGLKIVSYIREKCDKFTEQYKMNFSCYSTPKQNWAFI